MAPDTSTCDVEQTIRRRVTEQAGTWFPGTAPGPAVHLRRIAARPRAVLYVVHLGELGPAPHVLVKVRREWPADQRAATAAARPRLAPSLAGAPEQTAFEFHGLRDIHRIFGAGAVDDRFGAVRPLDHLAPDGILFMEYVRAGTLRQCLVGAGRLRTGRAGPAAAWRHAGAWLGVFQQRMPDRGQPVRQATREAVCERVDAYTGFLTRRLGSRAVGSAVGAVADVARDLLPDRLHLAVGHGDYAPRNVFAGPDGRVTVFDPMPRWRVPRYEDLARFLVAVRLSGSQLHTRGLAYSTRTLDRIEELVVQGYAAEAELSLPELRCFQLLVLLDRWSALAGVRGPGWRGRLRALPVDLVAAALRRETERVLRLAG